MEIGVGLAYNFADDERGQDVPATDWNSMFQLQNIGSRMQPLLATHEAFNKLGKYELRMIFLPPVWR